MTIYHLEANGRENTADYVRTICDAAGLPGIKVLTSKNSEHGDREIPIFGNYGSLAPGPAKLLSYLLGWCRLLVVLRAAPLPAILHIHWPRLSPMDLLFLRTLTFVAPGLRLIFTVHNRLPHRPSFYDRPCFRRLYRLASHLIFHSQQNVSDFVHEFGPIDTPYSIIPHYGYQVRVRPLPPRGRGGILFFGEISPYKGLELLLESLARLPSSLEYHLTVAGKPVYDLKPVKALATRLDLDSRIEWRIGWIKDGDVEELFNSHALVVLPYTKIDSSGALHLAMSYGKIIIASDIGVFRDQITPNHSGLLFPCGHIDELSALLTDVLRAPDEYTVLGHQARQAIEKKCGLHVIGKQVQHIYTSFSKL